MKLGPQLLTPEAAPTCDRAVLESLRQGTSQSLPRAGVRALGRADHPSALKQVAQSAEDLRRLGLELAARKCPFVDLPGCLGGVQRGDTSADRAASFFKSDACPQCPLDERCPGAPEGLDGFPPAELRAALRPLPTWPALRHVPRVLILSSQGQDVVFYASTLPALAEALRTRGATVEMVSPWLSRWSPRALPRAREDVRFQKRWDDIVSDARSGSIARKRRLPRGFLREAYVSAKAKLVSRKPLVPEWTGTSGVETWLRNHDLGGFDLVITSDFPTARLALARGSLDPSARIVALDFHMLKGIDDAVAAYVPSASVAEGGWWPSNQLVLESGFPGYVHLYLNYGVPLERVAWRPFPLYPGHFPPGPDVHECSVIMSGGNHLRDLATLRAATEGLPREVHPVVLYAPGEPFEANSHLFYEGQVPIRSFYHALAHSRFVVVPLREDVNRAAGVTVVAMALMAGRPVVATGIAAVRDYVHHEAEALLVPPGDPGALADAITRLDSDPALLSALSAAAREAGRRLSTEHWAEQIVSRHLLGPVCTAHGWRNW